MAFDLVVFVIKSQLSCHQNVVSGLPNCLSSFIQPCVCQNLCASLSSVERKIRYFEMSQWFSVEVNKGSVLFG